MKTRADIYKKEAAGLLRTVSLYPGLLTEQLCRTAPGKEQVMENLLAKLQKQGRIEQEGDGWFVYGSSTQDVDVSMRRAVWVLLDHIGQVEFHAPCDFPVKAIFLAKGEVYEIIDVPSGQEVLVAQALLHLGGEPGRRIVMVERPEQIAGLELPGTVVFCTVSAGGEVSYYQKNGGLPQTKED